MPKLLRQDVHSMECGRKSQASRNEGRRRGGGTCMVTATSNNDVLISVQANGQY